LARIKPKETKKFEEEKSNLKILTIFFVFVSQKELVSKNINSKSTSAQQANQWRANADWLRQNIRHNQNGRALAPTLVFGEPS